MTDKKINYVIARSWDSYGVDPECLCAYTFFSNTVQYNTVEFAKQQALQLSERENKKYSVYVLHKLI